MTNHSDRIAEDCRHFQREIGGQAESGPGVYGDPISHNHDWDGRSVFLASRTRAAEGTRYGRRREQSG